MNGDLKTFLSEEKLKEDSITSRPTPEDWLKEILQTARIWINVNLDH